MLKGKAIAFHVNETWNCYKTFLKNRLALEASPRQNKNLNIY